MGRNIKGSSSFRTVAKVRGDVHEKVNKQTYTYTCTFNSLVFLLMQSKCAHSFANFCFEFEFQKVLRTIVCAQFDKVYIFYHSIYLSNYTDTASILSAFRL